MTNITSLFFIPLFYAHFKLAGCVIMSTVKECKPYEIEKSAILELMYVPDDNKTQNLCLVHDKARSYAI